MISVLRSNIWPAQVDDNLLQLYPIGVKNVTTQVDEKRSFPKYAHLHLDRNPGGFLLLHRTGLLCSWVLGRYGVRLEDNEETKVCGTFVCSSQIRKRQERPHGFGKQVKHRCCPRHSQGDLGFAGQTFDFWDVENNNAILGRLSAVHLRHTHRCMLHLCAGRKLAGDEQRVCDGSSYINNVDKPVHNNNVHQTVPQQRSQRGACVDEQRPIAVQVRPNSASC